MAMMMAAAAKQPAVKTEQKEEGMSGMMKSMMKQIGKDKTPEEALAMAEKMGMPKEAIEKVKASMAKPKEGEQDMGAMMKAMMGKKPKEYSKEEVNKALAIIEVERTLKNVTNYKRALQESPAAELQSLIRSLNGGYTAPSPGGDPIVNRIHCRRDVIFLPLMRRKLQRSPRGRRGCSWQRARSRCTGNGMTGSTRRR